MIYFDNNATTEVPSEVFEVMRPYLSSAFSNPSSAYSFANQSAVAIEDARRNIAELIGATNSEEIVFTSGGTESDNWAIFGSLEANPEKTHIVTTRVEHEAVRLVCEKLEANGYEITWLDVDENGLLNLDELKRSLRNETAIVSIMLANNETGVIFPVEEISELIKEKSDALFHVDGVNAAGKIPIDLKNTKVDLFSISGHKFHAPKGVGALYIRETVKIAPLKIGGGQEMGRRAGTEAVHQIVGIGKAAELAADLAPMESVKNLRDRLEKGLLESIADSSVNGHHGFRLPNTSNISFENTNGEAILARLDNIGVCVSTGSACNAENHEASPVLKAMGIPYSKVMGSIRFSLGRNNSVDEVDFVLEHLPKIVDGLKEIND